MFPFFILQGSSTGFATLEEAKTHSSAASRKSEVMNLADPPPGTRHNTAPSLTVLGRPRV